MRGSRSRSVRLRTWAERGATSACHRNRRWLLGPPVKPGDDEWRSIDRGRVRGDERGGINRDRVRDEGWGSFQHRNTLCRHHPRRRMIQ